VERQRAAHGTTDLPLSEAGRRDAACLRARLASHEFALVLTSPLRRARETCELAGLGDRAELEADLREFEYGEYEGRTSAEIREERPGWSVWRDGSPGGELPASVGERADRAIARALQAGGDVAVFAHGHVLRVLGARWIELPAEYGAISRSGPLRLRARLRARAAAVWLWNDTSHLK
jgi:probable phosphoglycerate mutase